MNVNISLEKIIVFCIFFATIILGMAPSHADSTLSSPIIKFILLQTTRVMICISTFCFLFSKFNLSFKLLLPFSFYIISLINASEINPVYPIGILHCIMFCNILALNRKNLYFIFCLYRNYIVLMSALGIVAFLSFFLPIHLPYRIVEFYGTNKMANYIDFGFCYIYTINFFIFRLCGLFSEPGSFGTVIALFLCADELDFKKLSNKILLLAGFLTFSISFYIIMFIYYLAKNIYNIKRIIGLFIIFIICIIFFKCLDNPMINRLILLRLDFENGKINADNRIGEEGNRFFYNKFLEGDNIFCGYGGGYATKITIGSSFKMFMIDYGIFGFFFLNGLFFTIGFKQAGKNYYVYPFLVCLASLLYKSTLIIGSSNLIILLGGIEYIKKNYNFRYIEK